MAVTVEQVSEFVGASPDEHTGLLTSCLAEARALVDRHVGSKPVPAVIRDRAYVGVAADLFAQRNAPSGVMNQQYQTADGGMGDVIRISRDPMTAAYKLLRPWMRSPW